MHGDDTTAALRLGSGILTWLPAERELSRFGTVSLREPGSYRLLPFTIGHWQGMHVQLRATVTALRWPTMPQDPLLETAPRLPEPGREYAIGAGALFALDQPCAKACAVGVVPTGLPLRHDRWMDAQCLYDLHNHVVALEAHRIADPPRPPSPGRLWPN